MGFSDGESIKRSALHQPHHHLFHGMHFPARDERAQHGSFPFTFSTCTIAFATVFRGPAYWHQRMNKRTKQNKTATDGRIINQQGHPSHTPKTIFLTRLTISHRLMWWGVSSTFVHVMLGGYQKSAWILRAGGWAGRTRSFFFLSGWLLAPVLYYQDFCALGAAFNRRSNTYLHIYMRLLEILM